jgi:uncharacterized protein (DUF302 family)
MTNQGNDERGIVTNASPYASVSGTLERLRETVRRRGLEEFALIDHDGAAEQAGLKMQEATLLIFGGPKAGTPLMVASPLLALDLPLKVLVWRDRDGEVLVSYNATSYLASRHGIPEDPLRVLASTAVPKSRTLMTKTTL